MTIGPLRPGRQPTDRVETQGLDKPGERRTSVREAAEEHALRARKEIATRADGMRRARDSVQLHRHQAGDSQAGHGAIYSREEIQRPDAGRPVAGTRTLQNEGTGESAEPAAGADRLHTIARRIQQGFYDRPDIKARIAGRILDDMEGSSDYEG
ncbi:MAG: hypothetical protein OEW00_06080 [candidate division Zixibacteria bacterium]|nr:hypothetical protein [candidate division Zixibacteria bacterium]